MRFDLFGREEKRWKADLRLMEMLIRRTLARWPKPTSWEDLRRSVANLSDAEAKRIIDKSTKLGYVVESAGVFYPNNSHLAIDFKVVRCPSCGEVIPVKQWFKMGMGNELMVWLYCDTDQTLLMFQEDDPVPAEIIGSSSDGHYGEIETKLEERLRPCPCGGSFRHSAALRCPKCGGTIAAGKSGFYFVIDRLVDGSKERIWK